MAAAAPVTPLDPARRDAVLAALSPRFGDRLSTAAAILNAIHDAVGVRIHSLPATAEKVYAAIKAKRAQEAKLITAG